MKFIIQVILILSMCVQFLLVPLELNSLSINERQLIILISLGIIMIFLGIRKSISLPKAFLTILISAIYGWVLFSGLWAVHIALIWPDVINWTIYFLIFMLAYNLDKIGLHKSILSTVVLIIITVNIIQVNWSIVNVLVENNWTINLRDIESFPRRYGLNTNFLGALLILYIPVLMNLDANGFQQNIAKWNIINIAFVVVLFNSRAATLTLAFLAVFYLWRSIKENNVFQYLVSLFVILMLILCSYHFFINEKANYLKIYNPAKSVFQDTGDDRIIIWKNSIAIFFERPIAGYGAGNWKTEIQRYGADSYKKGKIPKHAHNFWIQILVELGFIGLLLILAMATCAIMCAVKTERWHFLAALISLAILCTFYGIYVPANENLSSYFILIFCWLGLSVKGIDKLNSQLLFVLFILMVSSAIYVSYSISAFNRYVSEYSQLETNELKEKIKSWDSFANYNIVSFIDGKSILQIKSNILWKTGLRQESIKVHETALKLHPYDYGSWSNLGYKCQKLKLWEKASECYAKTLSLYQEDARAALALTRIGVRTRNKAVFDQGTKVYHETLFPIFDLYYDDDFLLWDDKRIPRYWRKRCAQIDKFQHYLEMWQAQAK